MSASRAAILAASLLRAAAATNDIVAENLLPGSASDHWDVNGAGCPAVRGYITVSSALPGETTADLTWHAYNGYGGYTTYGAFTYPFLHEPFDKQFMNLSDPSHATKRAYKRSLNTPVITRDYRSVNARPLGRSSRRSASWRGTATASTTAPARISRTPTRTTSSRSRAYVSVGPRRVLDL
ncbi:hypothetical protein SO694_00083058 [Aureococcus anophagefferens]|uniref:Phospholipase B-like n=1 Tax=Aureococcus anophagefferens TaxID=44056 RepID=A0ABR1FJB6_AURAN